MASDRHLDDLTGLYNRAGLYEYFPRAGEVSHVQMIFFDLDNFKPVNDIYGHRTGDEVLVCFADILRGAAPEGGMLFRLGGDEFVLVLPGECGRDSLAALCGRVQREVRERRESLPAISIVSVSIGIVYNGAVEAGLSELLNRADYAMYQAKLAGKDAYVFYDEFEEALFHEKKIELSAIRALEASSFFLRYRPVISLMNSGLTATEACRSWRDGDGEEFSLDMYGAVLEKAGLIREIDYRIFELLCRDLGRVVQASPHRCPVIVRISHLTLMHIEVEERLGAIAAKYQADPGDIELDVDERVFSARGFAYAAQQMEKLKERGFLLGLTRFGEDFSSFRYLEKLPVDRIRFDREYVSESIRTVRGRRILSSLIELTKEMKIGISTFAANREEVQLLASCGCDAATGDAYTLPLSPDAYGAYVAANIQEKSGFHIYNFRRTLSTDAGDLEGRIIGEGVEFTEGISDERGALSFPGGAIENNLVELPSSLFNGSSFTIAMWVKPAEVQNWISAIFVRFRRGFASFMPSVTGGISIFRMHEDEKTDVWYDNIVAQLPMRGWSFVTAVFDAFAGSLRLYINGELLSTVNDVPVMGEPVQVYLGGDIFQESYRGEISALHIYDSVRTEAQVEELYLSFREESGYHGDEEAAGYEEYLVHDPAVYEDDDHRFYLYTTDANGWMSEDLVHWTSLGKIVTGVDEVTRAHTGSGAIWAPDIVKVRDEYRLYCSNSSWGVQRSGIFLATAGSAAGPFEPKGPVLLTDSSMPVNGIDANIIRDHESGEMYMVYGSFWGGVHLLKLNKETGFADEGEGIGICLAARPRWTDGAIEGPYMIWHEGTGYYYLFVSYGSLKSDYNVRVGRSRKITGPFVDYHGRPLADTDDPGSSTGLMILCGYKWLTGTGYMGPGHNSVLQRENGDMFLVCHIRKQRFAEEDPGPGYLQIRKMYMTPDGWPIVLSEPYSKETYPLLRDAVLPGLYERIEQRPGIPQGIMHAHPMRLMEGGRLEMGSVIGTWERTGDFTMELTYGPHREFIRMEKGLDFESGKTTVLMCGLTNGGICTWAKKHSYM